MNGLSHLSLRNRRKNRRKNRWSRWQRTGQTCVALGATEPLEARTLLTISTLSVADDGTTAEGRNNDPQLSRDGRFVAFQSRADDLDLAVGSDTNGFQDIFVRNVSDDTTTLISITDEGRSGDDDSWSPSISDDGRFVSFASFSTNFTKGVTITAGPNVFVHDRDTDKDGIYDEPGATSTRLISRSGADPLMSGDGPSGGAPLGPEWARRPVISGDGRFVAYSSVATDLLDPAGGVTVFASYNVYVSSTGGGIATLLSIDPTGTFSGTGGFPGSADTVSISEDGTRIAFRSNYENLIADDTEGERDVFVRDILTGITTRVSVVGSGGGSILSAAGGVGGNLESKEPVISRNGRHVVFTSKADNLVKSDTNGREDIFVHDLVTGRTQLVSMARDPASTSSTGDAASPQTAGNVEAGYDISDRGRHVVFSSLASDLLDPADGVADSNGTTDVFLFDRDADADGLFDEAGLTGTSTTLVSTNADGTDSSDSAIPTGGSTAVSISGNGRYAVFTSPGTNLIPGGTLGTGVYVRDLDSETTEFVALSGTPGALQVGVAESAISTSPLRVAFTSFDPDVDAAVTDDNVEGDVFIYEAPTDIRFLGSGADGDERLVIGYSIENAPADGPFEIGVYMSTDGKFDAIEDDLLDTITVDGSDLDLGARKLIFDIGGGPDEVALPGAGAPEVDFDYQILFVLDHLDTQAEMDVDPFDDDNTGRFEGIYHPPSGPVFVHGRTSPRFEDDKLVVTEVDASTLEVRFGRSLRTYDPTDVASIRFRGHEGDDSAQAAGTDDLLLGGDGDDKLRGGPGDDTIDGGAGDDSLFGEEGFDTIFDGMGDDVIDLGPDGGVIISTPGSGDLFDAGVDSFSVPSSLEFLTAGQGIRIDLDVPYNQAVDDFNTVQLEGQFANFTGSPFDDTVFADPISLPRILRGGLGDDELIVDARGNSATFDGTTITIPGFGPITVSGFEQFNIVNAAPRIIDDSDASGFSTTGFFTSNPNFPQGFNDGVSFSGADSGNTATWAFTDLPSGRYAVSATWTSAPDRASNAPFTIFDGMTGGTIAAQVDVNQEHAPNDFEDGGISWTHLAIVDVTGTDLTVELSDVGANEFVVADAIRIESLNPNVFQIDDGDPGFSNGTGSHVGGFGQFGDQELFSSGGGDAAATWTFSGVDPGPYVVSATWSPSGGAATDTPFTVSSGTDEFTVNVDQQNPPDDVVTGGGGMGTAGSSGCKRGGRSGRHAGRRCERQRDRRFHSHRTSAADLTLYPSLFDGSPASHSGRWSDRLRQRAA